jgi:acetyltransferase-like isoleucine patch superfamily enzyme
MNRAASPARRGIKRALDLCCLVLVAPCAALCHAQARGRARRQSLFLFWAQLFALVPGTPGVFARRAFYRLTLERCSGNFMIGFGAFFSHREVVVEADVYVGPYAIVGSARLRRGCLVGSRASILSGGQLHELDEEGRWLPANLERLHQVEIGEHAWIGEGAVVMSDVGRAAMVAAAAVVSTPVPPGIVVAGNPARFVRHLVPQRSASREHAVAAR